MIFSQLELLTKLENPAVTQFLAASVGALVTANRAAREMVAALPEPEQLDAFGHIQRAHFQARWRAVARKCGLNSEVKRNPAGTSSYTVVNTPEFIFTECCVPHYDAMPRYAYFREQLASIQLALPYDGVQPVLATSEDVVYAVLLHGHHTKTVDKTKDFQLGFVRVVVPDENWSVLASIDLSDALATALATTDALPLTATSPVAPPAIVQEPPTPSLLVPKKTKKTKDDDGGGA